jgi:hypothetical protein
MTSTVAVAGPFCRGAKPEGPSRIFAYVESENASVSISMKIRPSDPTQL